MTTFIPDKLEPQTENVPYFEDIKAKDVAGRRVEKPLAYYMDRIRDLMSKLGAYNVVFVPGNYDTKPARFGYQITFQTRNIPGRIDIAALPLRTAQWYRVYKTYKDRALAQALYLFGNYLEAELLSKVYRPGVIPLVPYMIGEGDKTVTESLIERLELPFPAKPTLHKELPASNGKTDDIVEAVISE